MSGHRFCVATNPASVSAKQKLRVPVHIYKHFYIEHKHSPHYCTPAVAAKKVTLHRRRSEAVSGDKRSRRAGNLSDAQSNSKPNTLLSAGSCKDGPKHTANAFTRYR